MLYGPHGGRTLEVMRSMLHKKAPLLFVHGTLTVLDALKEENGSVYPDYMLVASEMLCILCLDMNMQGIEALLLQLVIELQSALDIVSLDHRTSSLRIALKMCVDLIALGQLHTAQLLLDRTDVALPMEEAGIEISTDMRL